MLIKDIKPDAQSYNLDPNLFYYASTANCIIKDRETLKLIVDPPCLEACEYLFDCNILTTSSSANNSNDSEIEQIASFASSAGAYVMNIMPLIPCGSFSDRPAPSAKDLSEARRSAGKHMRLLSVCSQCRADACGISGRKESRGSCRDA